MRYIYAAKKFFQYRKVLKTYLTNKDKHAPTIEDIDFAMLKEHNIKALMLDFDGVLNSHAEPEVTVGASEWIKRVFLDFPETTIYILSNKPTSLRKQYFKEHFPKIKFIKATKKKPYPDNLEKIISGTGIKSGNVLVVDDRLATGILLAEIVGCKAILILKPYSYFFKRPIREFFFAVLRLLEQVVVRII